MHKYSRSQLEAIFKAVDENGDGFIDQVELQTLMQENDMALTSNQITELIQMADTNGDGQIDLSEFMQLISTRGVPTTQAETSESLR